VGSSLHAWQAIADRLAKFADEVPEGTFFGVIKIEADKIAGSGKPYINGGSVKFSFYFDDDGTPVVLKPEKELKIGAEKEISFTTKGGKKVELGFSVEKKLNPDTMQEGTSYKVKAGVGEVEISSEGDMKLEYGAGKVAGSYAEASPKSGQFGAGMYFKIGEDKKVYVGIHFQSVKEETLLAYFCHSRGFFERRSLDELFSPKIQWADLFPDEEKSLKALGFSQKVWDRKHESSEGLPDCISKPFDDLTAEQKCAAVNLGLRRSNWEDTWKKIRPAGSTSGVG
jgi:hypothetical protein